MEETKPALTAEQKAEQEFNIFKKIEEKLLNLEKLLDEKTALLDQKAANIAKEKAALKAEKEEEFLKHFEENKNIADKQAAWRDEVRKWFRGGK